MTGWFKYDDLVNLPLDKATQSEASVAKLATFSLNVAVVNV